jgi:hypothetical protein
MLRDVLSGFASERVVYGTLAERGNTLGLVKEGLQSLDLAIGNLSVLFSKYYSGSLIAPLLAMQSGSSKKSGLGTTNVTTRFEPLVNCDVDLVVDVFIAEWKELLSSRRRRAIERVRKGEDEGAKNIVSADRRKLLSLCTHENLLFYPASKLLPSNPNKATTATRKTTPLELSIPDVWKATSLFLCAERAFHSAKRNTENEGKGKTDPENPFAEERSLFFSEKNQSSTTSQQTELQIFFRTFLSLVDFRAELSGYVQIATVSGE